VRSLAVVVFIAVVAVTAGFAAQRRTIARGEVMAADLLKSNAGVLTGMVCDPEIPIGVDGAQFWCDAVFARGGTRRLHFELARSGQIKQIGDDHHQDTGAPRIDKTDPWQ